MVRHTLVDVLTEREHALSALRGWSAPGRRAQLLAAAWRAGEHTVSVLAEAARVTRQTVYTDLDSYGIRPSTQRRETPPMRTITIGGFTGTDTEERAVFDLDAVERDWIASGGSFTTEEDLHAARRAWEQRMFQFWAARYHNAPLAAAAVEAEARSDAQRALHRVELAWEALRTAPAWLAAFHAYVEAVHEARPAIQAWQDAADHTADEINRHGLPPDAQLVYQAEVPADQRVTADTDAPRLALARLDETHTRRREIAAETLSVRPGGNG
jgi:hypothetical protein